MCQRHFYINLQSQSAMYFTADLLYNSYQPMLNVLSCSAANLRCLFSLSLYSDIDAPCYFACTKITGLEGMLVF